MRVEFTSKTSKNWAVEGKYLFREDVPIHFDDITSIRMTSVPTNKYQEGEIAIEFLSNKKDILKFSYEDYRIALAIVKYIVLNSVTFNKNNSSLECTIESCLEQFDISANDIIQREQIEEVADEKKYYSLSDRKEANPFLFTRTYGYTVLLSIGIGAMFAIVSLLALLSGGAKPFVPYLFIISLYLTFSTKIIGKLVKVVKLQDKLKIIDYPIRIIFTIIALCMVMALGAEPSSSSEWDKLSDEEKEWYEDNYGDGKMEDINEAIEDYKNNN